MNTSRFAIGLRGLLSASVALGLAAASACGDDDLVTPSATGTGGASGAATTSSGATGGGGAGTTTSTGSGGDSGAGGGGQDDGGNGGAGGGTTDAGAKEIVVVRDDVEADATWTANKIYVIPRQKQLFVKKNATLTVEPGTLVQGEENAVLVITRGAKLIADGKKESPIVFTSAKSTAERKAGDWGGILVLGKAPINTNRLSSPPSDEATYEAFPGSAVEGKFGGTDPNDNSGVIRYVRVEFGGAAFQPDREFNNLTLAGVGAGTTIDYVQVHGGQDDGVELFGGTVNVKHLISSQNEDDGFDTDNGWSGKGQFIVIQHLKPRGSDPGNGYESDNHATEASYEATPRTLPTLYNVTMIGDKTYNGGTSLALLFRRGTGGKYYNHIITGFPGHIEIRDQATVTQVTSGNLFVKNSIIFDNAAGANFPPAATTPLIDEKATFEDAAWANRWDDPGLTDPLNLTAPNFKPKAGAAALTGGAAPPDDGFFETSATYVGAVGGGDTADWTKEWTSYPQWTRD